MAKKAAEGVEVRILYDDVGCIGFLDKSFIDRMNAIGVQCRVFNYVVPFLNIFMNNRDHRKIMVIDGKVGFTGGYNLADEYFNITHPYGYWKDTGVKLTGRAVQNFTMMFLEMWNVMGQADTDYEKYLKALQEGAEDGNVQKASGYVQPYADSPLDGEPVGENVYLNLIKTAKKRLYVATPYLIISDEMTRELGLAAKRGVDVRVFTPGIPDKKIIYGVTRSYYSGLVRQGVRVYEYTPGFLHAKQMLCDGDTATVGTINMDYRSLYHHFENGVWMHGCDAIRDIEADFDKLLQDSEEVTDKYRDGRKNMAVRGWQCIMRHEVIPVCPEVLGGLPTPRNPSEIVSGEVINCKGVNVDRQFREGAEEALRIAKENGIDLAILQSRSPSCGVKQIYDGNFTGKLIPGQGVFAQLLEKNGFRVMDCEEI